ncbi:MAG TPA: PepSY-associated TM helix domain-containing protein, partial [Methylocystis sp.]|nr:PepSY-associated TM helix domain-containing protein [Methylocystis sp.]
QEKLDLATLAERAEALLPAKPRILGLSYTEPDQVLAYFLLPDDPATGAPYKIGFDELYLDPWTGAELGHRMRADLSEGLINLMPFIYILHYRLAMGDTVMFVFGLVAIAWTLDCFVAFYLTLPPTFTQFWRRWKGAWRIKRGAGFFRLNFDLHRASGLWLWPMLFVFAWSSVALNIRPAFEWPMKRVFDYRPREEAEAYMMRQATTPRNLDWRAALARGETLMREQAALHGATIRDPLTLFYDSDANIYNYEARGSRDLFERSPKGGSTSVAFDGGDGALIQFSQPTGEHLGNTIEAWLVTLHMARIFGLPYRILVSVLGLVVAMLSVTGIYIWWKKRAARRHAASHRKGTAVHGSGVVVAQRNSWATRRE